MARKILNKPSVSLSDFQPKRVPFAEYETKDKLVGVIMGEARGVHRGVDKRNENSYEGLKGRFRTFPLADHVGGIETVDLKTRNGFGSGICFMPDAFIGPLIQEFDDAGDQAGSLVLNFMFAVYLGRRGEDGYQWRLEDILPVEGEIDDPLARLEDKAVAKLAAPTSAPAGDAAKPVDKKPAEKAPAKGA